MIKDFQHKGLKELFESGKCSKVRPDLIRRSLRILDVLEAAVSLDNLKIPGFDFHGLKGKPKRYSMHVNGPFCITFGWKDGHIINVKLENYH